MIHILPRSPERPGDPPFDPETSTAIGVAHLQEQRDLSLIIDSAPNGMILVDGAGVIELVNKQVEKMFGYERNELLGQSVELLLPERYRRSHPRLRAEYRREPDVRTLGEGRDLFGRRKDGSEFALEIGLSPIPTTEGILVLSSVVDVTARKLLEDKMHETVRLKSQFLANMSHEIRTPMNVIMGMSNLMLETELSAEQREYAQMIANGAESLLTIINDILDFSKIEAGKLEICLHDLDLSAAVEEVASFLAERAGRKGIELTCGMAAPLPQVYGDGTRIRQVLTNILGNAVKFTEKGEVNLTVTWEPSGDHGILARFEIRDSGIGMNEKTVAGLFEPFVQGDGSHTRKYDGTGLGLAISKKLVDLMGGTIGAHSELSRGSTFWFTIPLEISRRETAEQPALYASLAGYRALVIDDNETTCNILTAQMKNWMVDVATARDAVEGLALMRTAQIGNSPFDVVLLDYKMPGINGLDLVRILRADPALCATPVVLLTAFGGHQTQAEAERTGIEVQMNKPVQSRQLREALTCLLAKARIAPVVVAPKEVVPQYAKEGEGGSAVHDVGALLLVEDNSGNRQVALAQLDRLGYVCDVATNGEEAMQAVRSKNYALVLMDLQMPRMDGFEATAAIRALAKIGDPTRIIATTAIAMVGDRERCLAAGMDDYLAKPFRPRELEGILHRWLEPLREAS